MDEPMQKSRKRIREACEPCRRKKGRCTGEKPTCSLCARLGQSCSYAGDSRSRSLLDGNSDTISADNSYQLVPETTRIPEDESLVLQELHIKVTEVLDQVRILAASQHQSQTNVHTVDPNKQSANSIGTIVLPTTQALRKAAELYMQFCHCQPLPLFSPKHFSRSIFTMEPETRLSIAGLSLRFDLDDVSQSGQNSQHTVFLKSAKSLVMNKITEGRIELSTLQCLCILALTEFNDENPQQAGIYLSLAIQLSCNARLDVYARQSAITTRTDEYVRCQWSIIVLQYLLGSFGIINATVNTANLLYPPSDATNDLASVNKQNGSHSTEGAYDLGVVAYAMQMTEAWYQVRQYVHHRGKLDQYPPWSGQSVYSSIMFRQMELESQMPHKHRFKPSGFTEHPISVLSTNRHYWASWLYLQIIYHTIVCALNHPLLLSIHLRRFRVNQIPELFLQQTADMITSHTDWIIHLLEIAKDKQFEFSDPFLAQCIAVVATIFLQQSYHEDRVVRMEKQDKFMTCLGFVEDIGRYWAHAKHMASDLLKFERTVSKAYEASSNESSPNLLKHVDLTTFWKILDNTLYVTEPGGTRTIFGPSLSLKMSYSSEDDMLSTRPLPEPTRVHSLPHTHSSAASTPATGNIIPSSTTYVSTQRLDSNVLSMHDHFADSPFLAENFFALGQDFVGNADDWYTWTNT